MQGVEAGDKNSGKRKDSDCSHVSAAEEAREQDLTALPKMVPSHMANTDLYYGLIQVKRVNKKPELISQFIINADLSVLLFKT